MEKIVIVFGLIAGAILSVMMLVTMPFIDRIGFDKGMVIGYATMVLAFMLVFFGVRSYRENVGGGSISFGRAFVVGALITLVASVCYVATWQLVYYKLVPDFGEKHAEHLIAKERESGASQAEIDKKIAEMDDFRQLYKNPLINASITLVEPLPFGLIMSLVSAGILRRRRRTA